MNCRGPLALLAALVLAPAVAQAAEQTRFAVVIGANRGEPGEVSLLFAERDASRFADVLSRFGGVREDRLLLLRGRRADQVEQALGRLGERIAAETKAGNETVVFVYYSGHADAQALHLADTRLPLSRLQDAMAASGATLSILVVDACRVGELTRVKGAVPAQPFEIRADDRLGSAGSAIITSSAIGEDAQESDRLGGGVFTHHFVNALLGAGDDSGDQRVTLSEAYRYAYRETLRTTSRAPVVQHPTYAFRIRGREDLVVTRLTESAGLARVRLLPAGTWLLLPESREEGSVVELSTEGAAEVLVEPGSYVLRRRAEGAVFEGKARVTAGETRFVAATDLARIPYGVTVRRGVGGERHSAIGPIAGVEVAGPVRAGLGIEALAYVGGRADFEALAVELRLRAGRATADNAQLSLTQDRIGVDITALRLFDLGDLALGFGLRLGGDFLWQRFDTTGEAPDRDAFVGRVGPLLRVEYAPLAWLSLTATGGLDGSLLPGDEPELAAVPFGGLGLTVYVP
ncbi:MAG: caspase family protein [Myxococcales bacterium]|nr:caspase family protein [Myxococcales bacterium]